jgi:hypothetical protein
MHGQINLTSEIDCGSTFVVHIPVALDRPLVAAAV